jgi:hypothetical protein
MFHPLPNLIYKSVGQLAPQGRRATFKAGAIRRQPAAFF